MNPTANTDLIELAVFVRTPVLGKVKTRLAAAIGPEKALEVYKKLLAHTFEAAIAACRMSPDIKPVLWHRGPVTPIDVPADLTTDVRPQHHDSMCENLHEILRAPGLTCRGVIVIGADHPTLEPGHIVTMARLLDGHPVSIGPAQDGGFWALGTTIPLDGILDRVPLSRGDTLEALETALEARGLSHVRGPTLWDVDTEADLERWRKDRRKK